MAAPDLETLLDYATQFRAAGKSVMEARIASKPALISAKVFADMAPDNKTSPRIEVHYTHGAPTVHRRAAPAGKDVRYRYPDTFAGQLIFAVWTNRDVPANAAVHEKLCALVRATMIVYPDYFSSASVLPHYQLNKATPAAERTSTNQERTMDITMIPFDLHWQIYSDVWPVGV